MRFVASEYINIMFVAYGFFLFFEIAWKWDNWKYLTNDVVLCDYQRRSNCVLAFLRRNWQLEKRSTVITVVIFACGLIALIQSLVLQDDFILLE